MAKETRAIKRSSSNPILSRKALRYTEATKINLYDFKNSICSRKALFFALFTFLNYIFARYEEIYDYSKLDNQRSLPDFISDIIPSFYKIKASAHFLAGPYVHILVSLFFLIIISYLTYNAFNIINYSKFFIILNVTLTFNTLCNLSTQLPIPCYGSCDCVCQSFTYQQLRSGHSIFGIFLIYFLTFGQGSSKIPGCGQYMSSEFVSFQWNLGLFIIESIESYKPNYYKTASITIRLIMYMEMLFIVLLRNIYSVGVTIPIIFVEILWKIYRYCQEIYFKGYIPFTSSKFGKLFGFFEEGRLIESV